MDLMKPRRCPIEDVRRISGWQRGQPSTQRRLQQGVSRLEDHLRGKQYWLSTVRLVGRDFNGDRNEIDLVVDIRLGPADRCQGRGSGNQRSEAPPLPSYLRGRSHR